MAVAGSAILLLGFLQVFLCQAQDAASSNATLTWCPKRHQQLVKKDIPFQLCQPMSCSDVAGKGRMADNATLFEEGSSRYQCRPFTPSFNKCPKVFLPRGQYAVDSVGTLRNTRSGPAVLLGNYFLEQDRAVICASDAANVTGLEAAPLPMSCMPFPVPQDGYSERANKTIFVDSVRDSVGWGYYRKFANGSVDQVCYQTNYDVLTCQGISSIGSDEMTLMPDMSMHTSFVIKVTYPIGQYLLAEDGSIALICVQMVKQETESDLTMYLYGVASLISATCLLLALLAHLFFPRLNYHTKALLCLAFSLLVMYVAISVRNFTHDVVFSLASNITIFAVQYVFSLSAFLWLSVLAFDLWRVFSKVQGPISPEASQQKERRCFYCRCAYAYGIPIVVCAIIIGISFNVDLQIKLGMFFDFEHFNWLIRENMSILAFFYAPVLVILISNAVFFGLTIKNIRQASSGTDILHKDNKAKIQLFKVYIKLFVIMGLSWFAEVISWFAEKGTDDRVWYVSDLINCLQGVLIFLVYVCKKKTIKVIKERLHMITITGGSSASRSTPLTTPKSRKTSHLSMTSVYRSTDTLQ